MCSTARVDQMGMLRRGRAVVGVLALLAPACGGSGGSAPVTTVPTTVPATAASPTTVPPTTVATTVPPTTSSAPTTLAPTTVPPTTAVVARTAAECVADLPLSTRTGQVLLVLTDQAGMSVMHDLTAEGALAGVVVLGAPDDGVTGAIAGLQASSTVGPLVVAVDEEGGVVQRLGELLGHLPAAREMADGTPDEARAVAAERAEALAALGFTMNLAPVVDVGGGPGIGSRAFSDDPEVVVEYALAVATGIASAGLTPVFKHFPGHGRADADSHRTLPVTPRLDEMQGVDLVPWRELPYGAVGAAVMVGHLDVPGLTYGDPASLSKAAVDGLLRNDLGFSGVVIADYLGMGAVTASTPQPEAAAAALVAGADLLIVGDDESPAASAAMVAMVALAIETALDEGSLAVDRLNEAVGRGLALRGIDPCMIGGVGRG